MLNPLNLPNLEASLKSWNFVAYLATALVFIGVAGESLELFANFPKSPVWKGRLNKTWALALILGLGGELVSLIRTSELSGLVDSFLRQQAVDEERDAAQANQRAAEANALAQAARAAAERAQTEQLDLKNANLKLEAQLRDTQRANADAQQRIRALEEEKRPRLISPAQEDKIVGLLRGFSGQEVTLDTLSQEYEATAFSNQVADTLSKAGLKVVRNSVLGLSGQGFGVAVHDPQSAPPLASAIVFAFRSAGVDTGAITAEVNVQAGKFIVFVGSKPPVQGSSPK